MDGITFDTLAYSKKLIARGFTQEQAEGIAELTSVVYVKEFTRIKSELKEEVKTELETQSKLDEAARKQLATKGDVADVRLEIEKVRREIETLRTQGKDIEARLIKWQIGIAVVVLGIMAKGFNWVGF